MQIKRTDIHAHAQLYKKYLVIILSPQLQNIWTMIYICISEWAKHLLSAWS